MGNETSTIKPITLYSLPQPLVAIESKYAFAQNITLRIHNSGSYSTHSTDGTLITAAGSKTLYFAVEAHLSLSQKKVVLDHKGQPVVNIKVDGWPIIDYTTYFGPDSSKPLFTSRADAGRWSASKARVQVPLYKMSAAIEKPHQRASITLKGEWRDKIALIYLDGATENDPAIPIAQVRPNPNSDSFRIGGLVLAQEVDYFVDIAANVDIALVVTLCLIMDDELARQNRKEKERIHRTHHV